MVGRIIITRTRSIGHCTGSPLLPPAVVQHFTSGIRRIIGNLKLQDSKMNEKDESKFSGLNNGPWKSLRLLNI